MRLGRCDECDEIASIKKYDGSYLCPDCRFHRKFPEEGSA